MAQSTYTQWLKSLSKEQRAQADRLLKKFNDLGPYEGANYWVLSEVMEKIPQFARYSVLRTVWRDCVDYWINTNEWVADLSTMTPDPNYLFKDAAEVIPKMIRAGISLKDISELARMIGFLVATRVLEVIDDKVDQEAANRPPRWKLMEVDSSGLSTGRHVAELSADLRC